jgi:hypothetical protein
MADPRAVCSVALAFGSLYAAATRAYAAASSLAASVSSR